MYNKSTPPLLWRKIRCLDHHSELVKSLFICVRIDHSPEFFLLFLFGFGKRLGAFQFIQALLTFAHQNVDTFQDDLFGSERTGRFYVDCQEEMNRTD